MSHPQIRDDSCLFLRLCSFEQIALDADGGQQLRLRLRGEGQTPELDKAEGSVVIELVAAIVGCQAVVVKRVLRLAPDDGTIAMRELDAHGAAGVTLGALHVSQQVLVQRAIPLSVIDQPRVLAGHDLLEAYLFAAEREAFEGVVGREQYGSRRRLVDLA